jgi:DNA transposition AAA+ family ATPase
VLTGGAGLGKTVSQREYARRHPTATWLRAQSSTKTAAYAVRQIGQALGVRLPGCLFDAVSALAASLEGTSRLLIIDEAQHLGAKSLEVVRDLYDMTGIGIVLSGNGDVHKMVHGTGTAEFAQHFSRLGAELHVSGAMVTSEDVQAVLGARDMDPGALSFLHKLAQGQGGFRSVVKTFQMARRLRKTPTEVPETFEACLRRAHAMRYADYRGE